MTDCRQRKMPDEYGPGKKTLNNQNQTQTIQHRPLSRVRTALRINTTPSKPKQHSKHEDRFEQKPQLELQYKVSTALFSFHCLFLPFTHWHLSNDFILVLTFHSFCTWPGSPLPYTMYNHLSLCKCNKITAILVSSHFIVLLAIVNDWRRYKAVRNQAYST